MAWSAPANRLATSVKSGGTQLAGSPSATVAVGRVLIARAATEPAANATGDTSYLSLSDTGNNTWVKVKEYSRSDTITTALWYCIVTTQLTTSSTITLTVSASVTPKALSVDEWAISDPNVSVLVGAGVQANANNPAPSIDVGSSGTERLFYSALGLEGPTGDTYVEEILDDWTERTVAGTTGGASFSNETIRSASKVSTAQVVDHNPTLGAGRSYAAFIAALRNYTAPAQSITLGQASESDAADTFTVYNPTNRPLGQAAEVDTADALAVVLGNLNITLGQAAEIDTADTLTPVGEGAVRLRWWDGSAQQNVNLLGWWDGAAVQSVELLGWWDGSATQPLTTE